MPAPTVIRRNGRGPAECKCPPCVRWDSVSLPLCRQRAGGDHGRQCRAQERSRWPQLAGLRSHVQRNALQPLTEINRETVSRLNLAWTLDLDVTNNLRHRWRWTASFTSRPATASCTRWTPKPANCCGATTRKSPRRGHQAAHRLGHPWAELLEGAAVRRHP